MRGLVGGTLSVIVLWVEASCVINSTNEACRNVVYNVQNLHQANHCVVSTYCSTTVMITASLVVPPFQCVDVIIIAFLENATIGYSLESVCVCVCVCVFLHDNSKRNRSRNTNWKTL